MQLKFSLFFPLLFILSIILTLACKWFSLKFNILIDKPNARSSHSREVPRSGGLAIILAGLTMFLAFSNLNDARMIGYLIGMLLVVAVGIKDDIKPIKSRNKFLLIFLISLVPIVFGVRFENLGFLSLHQVVIYLFSFIWIFGMINAFNFMDGIDGLIGGVSLIGSFFLFCIAMIYGNVAIAAVALGLMAACSGFLLFNISPSSIFLGDSGSMFLGYNFAIIAIILARYSARGELIYAFGMIFAAIIYDSMFTFFSRLSAKKKVTDAHREHLYQRLVIAGLSHRDVSVIYYLLTMLFGIIAVLYSYFINPLAILLVLAVLIFFTAFVYKYERIKNVK